MCQQKKWKRSRKIELLNVFCLCYQFLYAFLFFKEYCDEVDAIVQLRYFQSLHLYELVEIPVSLFSQVLDVGKKHFAADGPTINIPIGKNPTDFTLKLDRSDAKVTIAKINKELCLVHGTWQLDMENNERVREKE